MAAFALYEAALVGNDVAALDGFFWRDPRALRYGAGENLYGHAAIAAFRAARPSAGLSRSLERTVVTSFGARLRHGLDPVPPRRRAGPRRPPDPELGETA